SADDVEDLAPGPCLPDAEVLVPHGRPRPVNAGITDQQLGERVSASGGVRRHSQSSHAAALTARLSTPRRLFGRSCYLDMKPPPEGGQANLVTGGGELFRGPQKGGGAGAELLPQRGFFRLRRGQMPLLDRSEAANLLRDHRKLNGDTMIVRCQSSA